MAVQEDDTQILALAQSSDATPQSTLDKIRAKREEHAAQHTLDVDVPGHDGLVGLRLGAVSARQLSVIAERSEKSKARDRTFNITLDTVGAAVVCVLVRDDAELPYDELRDAEGETVGLDERLVELLALTGTTQRALLLSLYANANSPELSIAAAAGELGEWATVVEREVDDTLVGESQAARIGTAVALALHGLPAREYLTTTDAEVRLMLVACAKRAIEMDDARQQNLAAHIVRTLAKVMR